LKASSSLAIPSQKLNADPESSQVSQKRLIVKGASCNNMPSFQTDH